MSLADERLLQFLACPQDKGPLLYFADLDVLYNPRLQRKYEIRDGIAVMLIDEAVSVDAAEHKKLLKLATDHGIEPNFEVEGTSS